MVEVLSPFVFWAQTNTQISLRIDLKEVKNPYVSLEHDKCSFSGFGKGARGEHKYSFKLVLFSKIDPESKDITVWSRYVEIIFKKVEPGFWPRLTASPQKPAWLKIDFDKWVPGDPDIDEEENRNIMEDYPDLYDKLQKEEIGYRIEDFKKAYLVVYNFIQFVGFLYVLSVIGVKYYKSGENSIPETYQNVGTAMKLIHLFMWMEVLHPIFGYTKNSILPPLMQVSGRNIILFMLIEAESRMQTKPVVFYLFVTWSIIEVVRYPYYITQLNNFNIESLTWLRYTLWIPLYPVGICCEGVLILRSIPYFEETKIFSLALPNKWNFLFNFPTVMKIYLLVLFCPAMYMMMSHMFKERVRKLGKMRKKSR